MAGEAFVAARGDSAASHLAKSGVVALRARPGVRPRRTETRAWRGVLGTAGTQWTLPLV